MACLTAVGCEEFNIWRTLNMLKTFNGGKMDELYEEQEELIDFARKNREELKPVEQWLNEKKFDDFADAWETAMIGPAINWRRIVFIVWMASDKKIYKYKFDIDGFDPKQWCGVGKKGPSPQSMFYEDFLLCHYETKQNPRLKLISNALEQRKEEFGLDENEAKALARNKQTTYVVDFDKNKCNRGKSVKLLEQIINDTQRKGVSCTERAYRSFRKFFKNLGYAEMLTEISHDKKTKKVTTTIPAGKLFISK